MNYTGPRNGVTESWRACAGLMAFECPDCGGHGHCVVKRGARQLFPMQRLPQADLGEGRDYFRIQQAAAAALVQSHVSGDPIDEGNLQHRVGASARRHSDDGLDDETQDPRVILMWKSYKQIMGAEKTKAVRASPSRKDGRRTLLLYLRPDIIKALEREALGQEPHAYEIAEGAISAWLASDDHPRPKRRRA